VNDISERMGRCPNLRTILPFRGVSEENYGIPQQ